MSYIQFQNVNFSYGDESILNNFSLDISEGRKVAIKGESGLGKTTILRLLLVFEQVDSGSIYFNQNAVSADLLSTIRRSTAWLPQDLNIGEDTVDEVIQRPFEFQYNRGQSPTSNQISAVLQELGLQAAITDQSFRDFSTGQRQRVGLLLCHLLDRPLLLLDELTSALDEASKQRAIGLLFQEPNRTIISTTHDPFGLERCDRVIELKKTE